MLRAKAVPEILGHIVGEGVTTALLLTLEGSLIGAAGGADAVDHKVVAAIASHTWGEYLHAGKEFNPSGGLATVVVELEEGRVAITRAGKGFLVCAYSSGDAQAGLLKARVESLAEHLAESLDLVNL